MTAPPRIWPVLLASATGLVVLLTLGVWQVQRLAWKENLIARLEANAASDPVDLATAERMQAEGQSIEFLKVWVVAAYRAGAAMKMMSTVDRGPGWTIIAPAVTRDGKTLLVDLGQVPDQKLAEVSMPEAETEIIGIVRLHNGGKAYFDPPNDPSGNLWYWWDRPAMLAAAGAVDGAASHPFVVQRIPQPSDQGFPRPAEPKANLRNNHLGYAITWFGLAAVLVVMTAIYVRGQMKKSAA